MNPLRLSRGAAAFLIATPLAWAALLLFHPLGSGQVYDVLRDQVTRWQIVHIGTLFFIGLMGIAVFLLVRDLPGRAARLSRFAAGTSWCSTGPGRPLPASPSGPWPSTRTGSPRMSAPLDRTPSRASMRAPSWATSGC